MITKNNKGFTLVELIIVIAILAVLAGIAAPNLINNINNARKKTDITNATQIANAIIQVIAEDDSFASVSVGTVDNAVTPPVYTGKAFVENSADASAKLVFNAALKRLQASGFQTEFKSKKDFLVYIGNGNVVVTDYEKKMLYPTPDLSVYGN